MGAKYKWNERTFLHKSKQDRGQKRNRAIAQIEKIPYAENVHYFWSKNSWFIVDKGIILGVATSLTSESQLVAWLQVFNPEPRRLTRDRPKKEFIIKYYANYCRKEEKDFLQIIEKNSQKISEIDELELSYL